MSHPDGEVRPSTGLSTAPATAPEGKRTSIYLPADLVPAVDRARAGGATYAGLIRDGLAALEAEQAGHQHIWACAVCHAPPEPQAPFPQDENQQAMAEMLAESRRRVAELEEILGSDRAAAEGGDLEGNLIAAREELSRAGRENAELRRERDQAQADRAHAMQVSGPLEDRVRDLERQVRKALDERNEAHDEIGALEARLSEAAEAAQEAEAAGITGNAAAEAELRSWRSWAGAVCQALGLGTDTGKVLGAIAALLPSAPPAVALPVPLEPVPFTTADHDQAGAMIRDRLAAELGPPRRDLEDLPAEDPHMQARGFPLEAGDEIPGDDDLWPSSFTDDPEE